MAGSRHHILPRFLLKGFASRVIPRAERQDDALTWVYRKGAKPFESKTNNVSVEKHFYGKDGDLNVDDEITSIESSFAISLDELRMQEDTHEVTDERIIEFVVHLSSRTKHLRDSMIDMAGFLADNLFGYLSDYDNWRTWCLEYYKRHPEVIRKALDDGLQKLQVSAYKKAMARQRINRMPVERLVEQMDSEKSDYESMFRGLRLNLLKNIPTLARDSHIKALAKDLVSEPRAEHYRLLHWYMRRTSEPLILGDVGCLFEIEGNERFMSMGGTNEEIINVFLPISSDCIVVGTSQTTLPQINVTVINEAIAKCSRDYFVCSKPSPEMMRLATLLGEESQMLTNEQMNQIISELITQQ